MTRAELNAVVADHIHMGFPEADDVMNDANREFIANYAATHKNAYCLKMEPFKIFPATDRIYNFGCEFVFSASVDQHEEIAKRVKECYDGGISIVGLDRLWNYLTSEFHAVNLLWS